MEGGEVGGERVGGFLPRTLQFLMEQYQCQGCQGEPKKGRLPQHCGRKMEGRGHLADFKLE